MFARKTYGSLQCDAGRTGRKSAKTFRSVACVMAWFGSSPYSPAQKNVSPSRTSSAERSIPRDSKSATFSGGKSLPTTPTIETGAKKLAATDE